MDWFFCNGGVCICARLLFVACDRATEICMPEKRKARIAKEEAEAAERAERKRVMMERTDKVEARAVTFPGRMETRELEGCWCFLTSIFMPGCICVRPATHDDGVMEDAIKIDGVFLLACAIPCRVGPETTNLRVAGTNKFHSENSQNKPGEEITIFSKCGGCKFMTRWTEIPLCFGCQLHSQSPTDAGEAITPVPVITEEPKSNE